MAKHTVTFGHRELSENMTVEAAAFEVDAGFVTFWNDKSDVVAIVAAGAVLSIVKES